MGIFTKYMCNRNERVQFLQRTSLLSFRTVPANAIVADSSGFYMLHVA